MRLMIPISGLSTGYLFGVANAWGWSFVDLAILVVVVAAVCALVFVALRQFGIAIPPWVVSCFWIVVVALVVILCIKLVAGMW